MGIFLARRYTGFKRKTSRDKSYNYPGKYREWKNSGFSSRSAFRRARKVKWWQI
jgi:hypothetical protein